MKNWIIITLLTWSVYKSPMWIRGTAKQEAVFAMAMFVIITIAVWSADWKIEEWRRSWKNQR